MSTQSSAERAAERILARLEIPTYYPVKLEMAAIINEEFTAELIAAWEQEKAELNNQLMDFQSRPDYESGYIDGSNAAAHALNYLISVAPTGDTK